MKRIFAVLIALLMVLSFAACGESKRTSRRDKKDKEKTTGVVVETAPVETNDVDVTVATQGQIVAGDSVFNTNDYALTVTSVDLDDSYYGIVMNVKAENKTADKEYTIMLENVTVNGLDSEGVCYIDVEGGESKNETACVTREYLEMAGINTVQGFTATFYIIDEDYKTLETKTYSYGETVKFSRTNQSTDTILVDKDGVKVVLVSEEFDEDMDYKMVFYIENNANCEIYVDTENSTINGSEEMMYLGASLAPGGRTFKAVNVYDFEFEELGIKSESEVKEIKFDLEVLDWEKFDQISTTPVTIKP